MISLLYFVRWDIMQSIKYRRDVGMREMLKKMLEDLEKEDIVMVNDIERFSDSPEEVIEVLDSLAKKDVIVYDINSPK